MYSVLSVGVNNRLQFAEKDAQDIKVFYEGTLGPVVPRKKVELLKGDQATIFAIANALLMIELDQPEFFVFFFSGHGSQGGILTANGVFPYESLIQHIEAIGANSSIVILDTCHAGAYTDFLTEVAGLGDRAEVGWLEALANATDGSRLMLSTGKDRTSAEGGRVQNGHFTHSLLRALERSRGDIPGPDETKYVSDQRAFKRACKIMKEELESSQEPVERYLTGDLPMARSQHLDPVGEAEIISAYGSTGVSLQVEFCLEYRRAVRTLVDCVLQNASGQEVDKQTCEALPKDDYSSYSHKFEFRPSKISKDPLVALQLRLRGRVRLNWILTVKDATETVLDRKVVPITYSRRR